MGSLFSSALGKRKRGDSEHCGEEHDADRVQLAKLCVGYNKANPNTPSGEFARLVRDVFTVSRGVDMSYKQSCMVAEKLARQIPSAQKHSCTQDEFIEAVLGEQQIFAAAEKRAILESTDQVLKLAKLHGSMHADPLPGQLHHGPSHTRWEAKRTRYISGIVESVYLAWLWKRRRRCASRYISGIKRPRRM
jgi:hypothetical protein